MLCVCLCCVCVAMSTVCGLWVGCGGLERLQRCALLCGTLAADCARRCRGTTGWLRAASYAAAGCPATASQGDTAILLCVLQHKPLSEWR